MKKIMLVFSLLVICSSSRASGSLVYSFKKDFRSEKLGPMLLLLKSIRKYPLKKRFVLHFFTTDERGIYKTTVNVDLQKRVAYMRESRAGWGTTLTKYTDVDVSKIRRAYQMKARISLSGSDNFELLEDVGCDAKVISGHQISVNGPD